MFDFIGTLGAVQPSELIRPLVVAVVWITAASFMGEPAKLRVQAVIVGAAAGAYMNGGFGVWELAFAVLVGFCVFRGLTSYRWIGAAWALHTVWDLAHHAAGLPMISWLPSSALDCAVTDTLLAIWFFAGAPDVRRIFRAAPPLAA